MTNWNSFTKKKQPQNKNEISKLKSSIKIMEDMHFAYSDEDIKKEIIRLERLVSDVNTELDADQARMEAINNWHKKITSKDNTMKVSEDFVEKIYNKQMELDIEIAGKNEKRKSISEQLQYKKHMLDIRQNLARDKARLKKLESSPIELDELTEDMLAYKYSPRSPNKYGDYVIHKAMSGIISSIKRNIEGYQNTINQVQYELKKIPDDFEIFNNKAIINTVKRADKPSRPQPPTSNRIR